jgi:4-amino-4-deoxy-L-arabinose transferase-like glycosyltransferase
MKIDNKKFFYFFILLHIILWTAIPTVLNTNLSLDTIEALTWGNELKLGYDKYPPIFPLFTELFYKIFGNQDWAYYLLSQLFVVTCFITVFKFSKYFFDKDIYSLLSVLLLEGIYFFNYTTPELNGFIALLPFIAITTFFCWKAINSNSSFDWILFGIFAGISTLTWYLALYLLASLAIFFIREIIITKKINYKYFLALLFYFLILSPHLYFIFENSSKSVAYALFRSFGDPLSSTSNIKIVDHLTYSLTFLIKQSLVLVPVFILLRFVISSFKVRINLEDRKLIFLFTITLLPIILMFLTSLIGGVRIRTMWMTTFYVFPGVFFIYLFKENINLEKLKSFFRAFFFIFIILPIVYGADSYLQKEKRNDFPGKKIADKIQIVWNDNFLNQIEIVTGEGWVYGLWYAGNLSYHLKNRPIFKYQIEDSTRNGNIRVDALNDIKDCKGILLKFKPYYASCLNGIKISK